MRRSNLRIFFILAIVSILGISITQFYWFKKAFDKQEREFKQNLSIALNETVKGLLIYNGRNVFPLDPISELDDNYYAAMVNDQINHTVLEHYLKNEFKKLNIDQNFEYRIYDCANKQLVFGGYVQSDDLFTRIRKDDALPKFNLDNYYFTVYFPNKSAHLLAGMQLWIFSSIVLFVVLVFFAYSLFVIFKQKRLSEIQKDFINNISHEVNTPLSIISLSAETIKNKLNNPQNLSIENYSGIILQECTRLKNQFEQILNTSESGSIIKLNKQALDVQKLILEKCHHIQKTYSNIQINLNFNADSYIVNVDVSMMDSILNNLIDNAIKYSKNEINISISCYKKNGYLVLEIQDKGIGIAKSELKKIFQKFYRVSTGDVHNTKGFGIGLSYVDYLIKLHKGKVEVESELGVGSTFKIYLSVQ